MGKSINDWTVLGFSHLHPTSRNQYWICKCKCGTEKEVKVDNIMDGTSKCCISCSRQYSQGRGSYRWKGTSYVNGSYFSSLRAGAKERNIPFHINIEDIENQLIEQDGKCSYSNLDVKFATKELRSKDLKFVQTASVDRINPENGYTKSNIQIVHKKINAMKIDLTEKEFFEFIRLIVEKQKNKK